jgi:hypothetical protein
MKGAQLLCYFINNRYFIRNNSHIVNYKIPKYQIFFVTFVPKNFFRIFIIYLNTIKKLHVWFINTRGEALWGKYSILY